MPTMSAPWATIHKDPSRFPISPNLVDYERMRRTYRHDTFAAVGRLPGGAGVNIAQAALDQHLPEAAGRPALHWRTRDGRRVTVTYGELAERSRRFANLLADLGVAPGERMFVLLGRVPDLFVAVLGGLRSRVVVSPLFSAFGPEPVRQRIDIGQGRVLVTNRRLYERKVAPIRDQLPSLEHVLLIDAEHDDPAAGTLALASLLAAADPHHEIPPTDPEDPALLHFTSGTTGRPKGAVHVHGAVAWHYASAAYALDLHRGDVFWCTADPGWVTGTSYGVVAPLAHGVTMVLDEGEFDTDRWFDTLEQERVTVRYTAPTAIRMLMRAGDEAIEGRDLSSLRFVASVGEPLGPAGVVWGDRVLGRPIHDNWWQTETGGIMIANFAVADIRPGSMGRPLPGIDAAIVRRGADGTVEVVGDDEEGELALRPGWPSMFRGYLDDPERYASCFVDGWYLSGDLVRRDRDGYFWFLGRADDVIKSAGHLIGPAEVESVLTAHPAVVEAAAIGVPDPVAGEVVKAFVTLYPGHAPDEDLRIEIQTWARARLGPAVAPREIAFADDLPKTRSGKIMRRLLRARDLGLPEGDLSTLEVAP